MLNKLINGMIVIFIGLIFLFAFIPSLEEEASTANITNTTVSGMGDIAVWIIPLLAIVSLILFAVNWIRSGKKGGF